MTVRAVLLLAGLLVASSGVAAPARADDLTRLEEEFEKAIKKVTPATVACHPRDFKGRALPAVTGVVISSRGLVLSVRSVGVFLSSETRKPALSDKIEVRLPNLKGKGFRTFEATVVHRDPRLNTSLLQIDHKSRFKYLEIGDSDALRVGDFTFVMGNSFGLADEAPPTITAGVVAALIPLVRGAGEGRHAHLYTSAAVNPGVEGGPVVDADGRLVGTVSTSGAPDDRFQYLGKCVPVARLRALYKDRKEAEGVFDETPSARSKSPRAGYLSTAYHFTARKANAGLVSLQVTRKGKMSRLAPSQRGNVQMPRYLGPVSGVLIDREGHIVTALYNLTNIETLVNPRWGQRAPYEAHVQPGLDAIGSVLVHFAGGTSMPARVTGFSKHLGIAMLKTEGDPPSEATPLSPAPLDAYRAGRFVLALGCPYGVERGPDPLLSVGVLSKQHAATSEDNWSGQWQTDAGCTDANAGGAAVTLRGDLLGIMNLWAPLRHGRNSGIGFITPWPMIAPHLAALKAGRKAAFMGVVWEQQSEVLRLARVVKDSPAGRAGLKAGDVLLTLDGQAVGSPGDARVVLRRFWAGDELVVGVRRGEETLDVHLTLGARPPLKKPEPKPDPKVDSDTEDRKK